MPLPAANGTLPLIALAEQRHRVQAFATGFLEAPHDTAVGGEVAGQLSVGGGMDRRYGHRGCPPPLAPGQQVAGPTAPERLRERKGGELTTVLGGVGPEFCTVEEAVLVQGVQAVATGQ